jgi:hypothetical protein
VTGLFAADEEVGLDQYSGTEADVGGARQQGEGLASLQRRIERADHHQQCRCSMVVSSSTLMGMAIIRASSTHGGNSAWAEDARRRPVSIIAVARNGSEPPRARTRAAGASGLGAPRDGTRQAQPPC